jgi:hypothetical protein
LINWIKKLFCKHKWIRVAYCEDDCFHIDFYECFKCNKRKYILDEFGGLLLKGYKFRINRWIKHRYKLTEDDVSEFLPEKDIIYLNRCLKK